MKHPVAAAFDAICDETLVSRVTVRAIKLPDLSHLPVEAAVAKIGSDLRRIYVCEGEAKVVLTRFIQVARGYMVSAYPDRATYIGRLYHTVSAPDVDPGRMHILTGPAGVGKTELLKALERVFLELPATMTFEGHAEIPLQVVHLVNARTMKSPTQVFRAIGAGNDVGGDPLEAGGRVRYRVGTCLAGVDELQFVTQSGQANAVIARILLGLHSLPFPTVAACNYSLLHRVMKRPVEERQRYLARVVVLLPDAAESEAWIALLMEFQVALANFLDFDLESMGSQLWQYAAGGKRALIELILLAYRCARECNRRVITAADISVAYSSHDFRIYRDDVEAYLSYLLEGRSRRLDLVCPLPQDISREKEARALAKAAYDDHLAKAAREEQLSPMARKVLNAMASETAQKKTPDRKPAPRGQSLADLQDIGRSIMEKVIR